MECMANRLYKILIEVYNLNVIGPVNLIQAVSQHIETTEIVLDVRVVDNKSILS